MIHAPSVKTKALEKRRLKAGTLFAQGKTQAWVARHFFVSTPTTNAWCAAWKKEGNKGLLAKGRPGAPPKLSKKELKKVEASLMRGPRYHGYETELWTLERIAKLIKKETKVSYHPGHVRKILGDLGWTSQKPETRARERNEKNIRQWVRDTFPRIQKRAPHRGVVGFFR